MGFAINTSNQPLESRNYHYRRIELQLIKKFECNMLCTIFLHFILKTRCPELFGRGCGHYKPFVILSNAEIAILCIWFFHVLINTIPDLERPPILKISHRLQSLTIIDDILIAEIRQKQFMLSSADTDLRWYKTATLCYANVSMVQIKL